jgi:hypothetical protein
MPYGCLRSQFADLGSTSVPAATQTHLINGPIEDALPMAASALSHHIQSHLLIFLAAIAATI